MEHSMRTLARFMFVVFALLVAIVLMEQRFIILSFLLLRFLFPVQQEIFFPFVENFFLPAVALLIILAGLRALYLFLAHRVDAARGDTGRVRLKMGFAAIGLLFVLAFAFSEYSKHQQRQAIILCPV